MSLDNTALFTYQLTCPSVKILQSGCVFSGLEWTNPNRNAPFWRLYINLSDGAFLQIGNQEWKMQVGCPILIPPHTRYASKAVHDFEQFYLHFMLTGLFANIERRPVILPFCLNQTLLTDIKQWYLNGSEYLSLRLYALLFEVLRHLPDIFLHRSQEKLDTRIEKALQKMCIDHSLSNREIATAVHMSTDNFIRVFFAQMGVTPQRYLKNRKMEIAQNLLLNSKKDINQIAAQTGFSNRYHFSRNFKEFFSMPPVLYRKKYGSSGVHVYIESEETDFSTPAENVD